MSKFPAFERSDGKKRAPKKRVSAKVPELEIVPENSTPRATQPPAPVARAPSPSPAPPLHRTDTEPRLASPSPTPAPTLTRTLTAPWSPPTTFPLNELLESDKVKLSLPAAPCSVILDPDPYERRRKRATLKVELKSNPKNVRKAIETSENLDVDSCVASIDLGPAAADLDHVLIKYHGFSLAVKQDAVYVWSTLPSLNAALADPRAKLKALMQSRLIELFSVIASASLS